MAAGAGKGWQQKKQKESMGTKLLTGLLCRKKKEGRKGKVREKIWRGKAEGPTKTSKTQQNRHQERIFLLFLLNVYFLTKL